MVCCAPKRNAGRLQEAVSKVVLTVAQISPSTETKEVFMAPPLRRGGLGAA